MFNICSTYPIELHFPHPEEFDAFNDDTFGDGGGDEWNEDAHEALAAMTEEEMKAVQVGGQMHYDLFSPLSIVVMVDLASYSLHVIS